MLVRLLLLEWLYQYLIGSAEAGVRSDGIGSYYTDNRQHPRTIGEKSLEIDGRKFFNSLGTQLSREAVWRWCIAAQQQQSSEANFTVHRQNNKLCCLKLLSRPTLHDLITMTTRHGERKNQGEHFWREHNFYFLFLFQSNLQLKFKMKITSP